MPRLNRIERSNDEETPMVPMAAPRTVVEPIRSSWSHDARSGSESEHAQSKKGPRGRPRHYRQGASLVCLYVPFLLVPWVLTCIMWQRPIHTASYYNQHGFLDYELDNMDRWVNVINVLNSIASLLTIPVLSALVAQAAAVYSERHRPDSDRQLEYVAALADRGWTDLTVLKESWRWKGLEARDSRFLLHFAAVAILLGAIQQPLYQILAPMESMRVLACQNTNYVSTNHVSRTRWKDSQDMSKNCVRRSLPARPIGWDVEPSELRAYHQQDMIPKLITDLGRVSIDDTKPSLWANFSNPSADKQVLSSLTSESFVAALDQGTTTGVLREHILRLNSSVSCKSIPRSLFPSSCPGDFPFTTSFSHERNLTRVCVPGNVGISPWTDSRNRQDIAEELFLDISEECNIKHMTGRPSTGNLTSDLTLHCIANTTRGYFELGNYRNNDTWSPLMSAWPSQEFMQTEANDYKSTGNAIPTDSDFSTTLQELPNVSDPKKRRVPGPLAMATVALFGEMAFFDIATQAWNDTTNSSAVSIPFNRLCSQVPFARLEPELPWDEEVRPDIFPHCTPDMPDRFGPQNMREFLSAWLHGFALTEQATKALMVATYLVNEATLTMDKWDSAYRPDQPRRGTGGRTIYSAQGATIHKPRLALSSIIVMSCIIFLELVVLGFLTWLIYRNPSQTRKLDVMTFAKLKEDMENRAELLSTGNSRLIEVTHDGPHSKTNF